MGLKYIVLLFLALSCQSLFAQENKDSTSFNVVVKKGGTGELLPNEKIVLRHLNEVIADTVTNANGRLFLKYPADKFPEGSLITIDCNEEYSRNDRVMLAWTPNHEFFCDVYVQKNFLISCGPFIYPEKGFVFEGNKVELSDSLESRNFRLLADLMIENPMTIIQAKALYNFNEPPIVAKQRLDYLRSKLKDYKINPDRIVFKVMKEEYVQDYHGDSNEVYMTLNKANYKNASPLVKEVYAQKFQRIEITIVSWDYKPEDHE